MPIMPRYAKVRRLLDAARALLKPGTDIDEETELALDRLIEVMDELEHQRESAEIIPFRVMQNFYNDKP